MEFSRIGEHTIKCVISEEEISDLGFTLDEIMSNGERTQEFMNHIFELAEEEFQMKFDLGVKTVRADFLPNHTLSLTFSEHPGAGGMVEHLKDIFNGLLNAIPQEKWEELKNAGVKPAQPNQEEESNEDICVIVLFTFHSLDAVMRFSRQVDLEPVPQNALYKLGRNYMLVMDLSECAENEVLRLSVVTDEYASNIEVGPERRAFLEEHGTVILKEHAIENLRQI